MEPPHLEGKLKPPHSTWELGHEISVGVWTQPAGQVYRYGLPVHQVPPAAVALEGHSHPLWIEGR